MQPTSRQRRVPICSIGILSILLLAAGCGDDRPPTAPVTGTVHFNGKPLHTGTVTFVPDPSGPPAYGNIGEDGSYRLTTFEEGDGAVLGAHKVIVSAVEIPDPEFPEARPLIPFEYSSEQTSGLTAQVKDQEENVVDFELTSKPDRRK